MIMQVLCMVIAVILFWWSSTDIMLKKESKRCFQWSVVLIFIVSIAEIGCGIFDNTTPENRIWSILFNMIGFGASPLIFLCASDLYNCNHKVWISIPGIINLLMVCVSPIFGWIFYVTPSCSYHRGPLFFLYIVIFGFYIIFSLIQKVKALNHFPPFFKKQIISSSIVMIGGILVQVFFPQYHTTWIIICVYFVLHYALACEISSMVDGLTGLLNKTVFSKQMQYFQKDPNFKRYLLMMDVNDFKEVNDKLGHMFGDLCLKEIATVLKESFDSNSNIYRFGGDEFCIVYEAESKEEVEQHIAQLYHRLEEKRKENVNLPSVAVGYEKFYLEMNICSIINMADEHMYEAKLRMKR